MWRSDNSNDHDNSNEPVQFYIAYHFPDAIKFPQVISLNPIFLVGGNVSLRSRSRKISHYSSHLRNDVNKRSEEEGIEVF